MSKYKDYTPDQLDELLSNYLIDNWSYSKVSSFARNEKNFERIYLYNERDRSSSSTIAGRAYHKALDMFFDTFQSNVKMDIVELEQIAFNYIDSIPADEWKIQKTTPTVSDCIQKSTQDVSKLLNNFFSEIQVYLSEIKRVISTELKITTWVKVNGVDIPLPLHSVIDMIIETNDNKKVLIDHKSKTSFTNESDLKFSNSKQAITYVLGYESEMSEKIDEVWFIENKISKNKDNSPQLSCFKITIDKDTRRLYEAILYEPLKRMLEAVNNPNYIYLINDNDNFVDKAELYDFWAKTMIAEVDDFNISDKKKEKIENRIKKIRDASLAHITPTVIRNFKKFTEEFIPYDLTNKNMSNQEKIEHVLRSFGLVAKVQYTFDGYSSSSYLLELNAGTQISTINKYRLDIANALNVSNVRIQKDLFVYEGKSYLAIESGKKSTNILAWDRSKLESNKIPIGVDNFGGTIFWDLDNNSTPHMLVGGATGSGKSVSIKSTIEYALLSGINDIYIFDPKYEFTDYSSNSAITVLNDISDIEAQMDLLVTEMEHRVKSGTKRRTLIVFDEFADAVANSRKGNELKVYGEEISIVRGAISTKKVCTGKENSLEENLRILLQKGRSSGFRIMAATQRASTKVITGDAKVNFPVQVCFRVPKEIDSMVVLDEPGAEALNGRGDGLMKSPEYFGVVRFQAFYKD